MECNGIVLYAQSQPNGAHNRAIQHKQRISTPPCNETDTNKQRDEQANSPKSQIRGSTQSGKNFEIDSSSPLFSEEKVKHIMYSTQISFFMATHDKSRQVSLKRAFKMLSHID